MVLSIENDDEWGEKRRTGTSHTRRMWWWWWASSSSTRIRMRQGFLSPFFISKTSLCTSVACERKSFCSGMCICIAYTTMHMSLSIATTFFRAYSHLTTLQNMKYFLSRFRIFYDSHYLIQYIHFHLFRSLSAHLKYHIP